jgi:hypothetical protein
MSIYSIYKKRIGTGFGLLGISVFIADFLALVVTKKSQETRKSKFNLDKSTDSIQKNIDNLEIIRL